MKKLPILALAILLLAGGSTLGYGQDSDGGRHSGRRIVDQLRDHERRIEDGEHSGELTRGEADRLRAKEDFVRAKMDDFLHHNHGYLTDNEENSLQQSLDETSGKIHHDKHDGAVR